MLSTWWLGFNCFNHPPSWFFWDFMVIFDGFKSLLMVLFPMYDLNYLAITMFQITSQFANWKITMFKFRKKWEFVKSARSRHLKLLPIFQQLWPPGAGAAYVSVSSWQQKHNGSPVCWFMIGHGNGKSSAGGKWPSSFDDLPKKSQTETNCQRLPLNPLDYHHVAPIKIAIWNLALEVYIYIPIMFIHIQIISSWLYLCVPLISQDDLWIYSHIW